jgi:membrane associated rhomboid family serine protease
VSRRSRSSSHRDGAFRPVVETLAAMVAASIAYWLVGLLAGPLARLLFVLSGAVLVTPWTLVTSVYAHTGIGHLLSNALVILVAGIPVAATTTRVRFHAFVLATGALAGLSQVVLAGLGVPLGVGVVGISGAAFALVGYVLAANPAADALRRVADRLDVSPRVVVGGMGLLALVVTLALSPPGSAVIAHLAGLILGAGAGRVRLLRV